MGVSVGPTSSGGRKAVDAELNLIPFIDLLSVCILFLLMTAVWVQISKMSAITQPGGQNLVEHSDVSNLNAVREDRDWDIIIQQRKVRVVQNGRNLASFDVEESRESLTKLAERFTKKDGKVSIRAGDEVVYEHFILVLDAVYDHNDKFTTISVGGL